MDLKLVIFDCDGVLVDTEPVTDRLIAASLTAHGFPIAPEEAGALFIGGTIQGVFDEVTRRGGRLPADWVDQMYQAMFAALAEGVPVFDGVFHILDKLDAARIATAIASNGPRRKMEISLTPSGLAARFAGRIHSGHDLAPKPDPAMLHAAMRAAGAAPDETVFIDDSLTGARAGLAAGVRTLGFVPHGDDGSRAALGITPVRSMAEVAALLGV